MVGSAPPCNTTTTRRFEDRFKFSVGGGGGGRFEQLRLVMDSARQMGDHPHHNCCSILSCFGLHNNLIHFSNRAQLFQRYMDRNLLKIIGT